MKQKGKPYQAYWISPLKKIFTVEFTHIEIIIESPEEFGLTADSIKSTYIKHNEPIGFEGYAREVIMKKLLNKGWVRLRWRIKEHHWICESSGSEDEIEIRIKDLEETCNEEI